MWRTEMKACSEPSLGSNWGILILHNLVHRGVLHHHKNTCWDVCVCVCMLALLLRLCLFSCLRLQHNHELCHLQWTAAAPLKISQTHLACAFEKDVPQNLYRLVRFTTKNGVFSIQSTNPYYTVSIVVLSFNPCVGKLAQSQRRQSLLVFSNTQGKKKLPEAKRRLSRASTRDVILSEPSRLRTRSAEALLTAQAYLFGSVT